MTLLEAPILAQRDPRWGGQRLGNSQFKADGRTPVSSIGAFGCLFMAVVMMVLTKRQNYTVENIHGILKENGIFGQGERGAYFETYYLPLVLGFRTEWISGKYLKSLMPADEVARIVAWLRAGKPAVLEVNVLSEPQLRRGGQHFVLGIAAFGSSANPQIVINDPWYADQTTLAPRFGANARIGLVRGILYEG